MNTAKSSKRIESITIKRMVDTDPDTSDLGEYSSRAESDYAIDREERGDAGRNEYQYFNPNHENYKGCTESEIHEYCEQDYRRSESLNRGDWCYLGIRAEALVLVGDGVQTIRSGGLWGIESDSNDSYFDEVKTEELSQLKEQLYELGFSKRAIATACKNIKTNCD